MSITNTFMGVCTKTIKLENGVKLVLGLLDEARDTLLKLTIRVGKLDDPNDSVGISSILSYLVLNGPVSSPNLLYKLILEHNIGCVIHNSNYLTSFTFSLSPSSLSELASLLASTIKTPTLCKDEIQKAILTTQKEYTKGVEKIIAKVSKSVNHKRLCQRKDFKRQELLDFHKTYYTGANVCIQVLSCINIPEQEQITKVFESLIIGQKNNSIYPLVLNESLCESECSNKYTAMIFPIQFPTNRHCLMVLKTLLLTNRPGCLSSLKVISDTGVIICDDYVTITFTVLNNEYANAVAGIKKYISELAMIDDETFMNFYDETLALENCDPSIEITESNTNIILRQDFIDFIQGLNNECVALPRGHMTQLMTKTSDVEFRLRQDSFIVKRRQVGEKSDLEVSDFIEGNTVIRHVPYDYEAIGLCIYMTNVTSCMPWFVPSIFCLYIEEKVKKDLQVPLQIHTSIKPSYRHNEGLLSITIICLPCFLETLIEYILRIYETEISESQMTHIKTLIIKRLASRYTKDDISREEICKFIDKSYIPRSKKISELISVTYEDFTNKLLDYKDSISKCSLLVSGDMPNNEVRALARKVNDCIKPKSISLDIKPTTRTFNRVLLSTYHDASTCSEFNFLWEIGGSSIKSTLLSLVVNEFLGSNIEGVSIFNADNNPNIRIFIRIKINSFCSLASARSSIRSKLNSVMGKLDNKTIDYCKEEVKRDFTKCSFIEALNKEIILFLGGHTNGTQLADTLDSLVTYSLVRNTVMSLTKEPILISIVY